MAHTLIPRPIVHFLHLIDVIGYCISLVLHCLGLHPSFQWSPAPWEYQAYGTVEYVVSSSPSSTMPPPSSLKSKLAVMEYGNLVKKQEIGEESKCLVCLGGIGWRDEIRELGNCCHAFHRNCIDQWIDVGQVTCPLCRAELLPANKATGCLRLFLNKLLK